MTPSCLYRRMQWTGCLLWPKDRRGFSCSKECLAQYCRRSWHEFLYPWIGSSLS